jgi:hypothetical protein
VTDELEPAELQHRQHDHDDLQDNPERPGPGMQRPGAVRENELTDPDREQDQCDQALATVDARQPDEPLLRVPPGTRPENRKQSEDRRGDCKDCDTRRTLVHLSCLALSGPATRRGHAAESVKSMAGKPQSTRYRPRALSADRNGTPATTAPGISAGRSRLSWPRS